MNRVDTIQKSIDDLKSGFMDWLDERIQMENLDFENVFTPETEEDKMTLDGLKILSDILGIRRKVEDD